MKAVVFAPFLLFTMVGCAQPSGTNTVQPDVIGGNDRPTDLVVDAAGSEERTDANVSTKPVNLSVITPVQDDTQATRGYNSSVAKELQNKPSYTGDADIDFNQQMRVHHMAAIEMAKVQLASGKDAQSKQLAAGIISAQEKEIAQIDTWLAKRK